MVRDCSAVTFAVLAWLKIVCSAGLVEMSLPLVASLWQTRDTS